jgi:alpha/beta superfamily hydrolase
MSEGEHDRGHGEQEDVRAALNWLNAAFHLPLIFCGFSFGAATGLPVCCGDERVVGLISLGTPVGVEGRPYTYGYLADCTRPKLFVSGSRDQYGPPESLKKLVDLAAEPKEMVIVEGGDHFFEGHLPEMQAAIHAWVRKLSAPGRQAEAR